MIVFKQIKLLAIFILPTVIFLSSCSAHKEMLGSYIGKCEIVECNDENCDSYSYIPPYQGKPVEILLNIKKISRKGKVTGETNLKEFKGKTEVIGTLEDSHFVLNDKNTGSSVNFDLYFEDNKLIGSFKLNMEFEAGLYVWGCADNVEFIKQ